MKLPCMRMVSLFLALLASFLVQNVAIGATLDYRLGSEPRREVGIAFEFIEDPDQSLAFENLNSAGSSLTHQGTEYLWKDTGGATPNFGYSNSTFWGRLTIERSHKAPLEKWVLENAWPHVDRIELRVLQPNLVELYREVSGLLAPQDERTLSHRNPTFSFDAPAGQSITLFLKIDSVNALQFPLVLWSRAAFLENDHDEQFVFGIFYGILIVMILYNLFIYLGIREKSYLDYVLFISGLTLLQADVNKYTYEYLWPQAPDWTINSVPMIVSFTVVLAMRFITGFLDSKERYPAGHRILVWAGRLQIPGIIVPLVLPHSLAAVYCLGLAGVAIVTAMVSTLKISRDGYEPARYFLFAWGAFLLGALTIILRNFQIVPATFITAYGLQIGIALGVLLLSFSLAARIRTIKKAKEEAEAASITAQIDALRKSEEAARVKSEFLANMSHELRTPLNALCNIPRALMTNFSEQLVWECHSCQSYFEDETPPKHRDAQHPCPDCPDALMKLVPIIQYIGDHQEQHHFIKRLDVQAQELLGLVERVLSFNDASTGGQSVDLEEHPTELLFDVLVERFTLKARERDQNLKVTYEVTTPTIRLDKDKVEKCLEIVLDNALKCSMDGGKVDCIFQATQPNHLVVTVQDEGIGIPGGEVDKIFTPFYQIESSHTRQFGGAGLGLALAKELIELHGGQIEVESIPGTGATFILHFRS